MSSHSLFSFLLEEESIDNISRDGIDQDDLESVKGAE